MNTWITKEMIDIQLDHLAESVLSMDSDGLYSKDPDAKTVGEHYETISRFRQKLREEIIPNVEWLLQNAGEFISNETRYQLKDMRADFQDALSE